MNDRARVGCSGLFGLCHQPLLFLQRPITCLSPNSDECLGPVYVLIDSARKKNRVANVQMTESYQIHSPARLIDLLLHCWALSKSARVTVTASTLHLHQQIQHARSSRIAVCPVVGRCIPPVCPRRPVGACHLTAAVIPPFGARGVVYTALSSACFTHTNFQQLQCPAL